MKREPNAKRLIEGFYDPFGEKRSTSVLMVREDQFPETLETLTSFRNVVALSCLIRAWETKAAFGKTDLLPLFSDYFDVYPVALTKDGEGFLTLSPAVSGYHPAEDHKFRGTVDPALPATDQVRTERDTEILDLLLSAWKERYVTKHQTWPNRALFRSLEMAYQAASVPAENQSSIYDYGSRVGLWVSAFEALAHPRTKHVDKTQVLDFLERMSWSGKELLDKRYKVRISRTLVRDCSLVPALCAELYSARNDFLHGNEVEASSMFPFMDTKAHHLGRVAGLVFKVALKCALEEKPVGSTTSHLGRALKRACNL